MTTMCDPFAVQLTNQLMNATVDFSVPFPDSCKDVHTRFRSGTAKPSWA